MAPFEGFTSVDALKAIGIFTVIVFFGMGLTSLYHRLTQPPDYSIFGVDDDVLLGIQWLVLGILEGFVYRHLANREAAIHR